MSVLSVSSTSRPLCTMKILHALVGYLAVTALPFHPFAFASSLAPTIDNDGYVNLNTQNHVLGQAGAVEICQTIPMQNNGNTALMKRASGDIIEKRWSELAPSALAIVAVVIAVTLAIVWIESDDPVRANDVDRHFLSTAL